MSTVAARRRPAMAVAMSPMTRRHAAIRAEHMLAGYPTDLTVCACPPVRHGVEGRLYVLVMYVTISPGHRYTGDRNPQATPGEDHDHPAFHPTRRPCRSPDGQRRDDGEYRLPVQCPAASANCGERRRHHHGGAHHYPEQLTPA